MKFIIPGLLAVFLTAAFTVTVSGTERFLHQTHSIEVVVECIDTALGIIDELDGYNIEANVQTFSGWDRSGRYGLHRHGHVRRSVSEWSYRHVQEAMRALGEVVSESESAVDLRWEIMDADVRIRALSTEIERLTQMMAASTTLDTLIAINDRLNNVSRQRDSQIGRRNLLMTQSRTPEVMVRLSEIPSDAPAPLSAGFGSRISDSFFGSWNNFRRGAENFAVFVAGVALPLLIWAAVFVAVFFVGRRLYVKRLKHSFGGVWAAGAEVLRDNYNTEATASSASGDDATQTHETEGGHDEKK